MAHNPILLDTNAVLRFLLKDIEEQALAAKAKIASGACMIPVEVIPEIVYVLSGPYGLPRTIITDKIEELCALSADLVEKRHIVSYAVQLFAANTKLDIVDCLLAGYHKRTDNAVFTFDQDLQKQLEKQEAEKQQ
ncbi:MAG: PIN domain-containing protein [Treponema sp.]|jgi:predicted nucleic-acid-binding protein|nr:PIN domain-containing protein [Treponema sp.]